MKIVCLILHQMIMPFMSGLVIKCPDCLVVEYWVGSVATWRECSSAADEHDVCIPESPNDSIETQNAWLVSKIEDCLRREALFQFFHVEASIGFVLPLPVFEAAEEKRSPSSGLSQSSRHHIYVCLFNNCVHSGEGILSTHNYVNVRSRDTI